MQYEPSVIDLLWAQNVLKLVKDGGVIVYPNTALHYQVDHTKRTLVLRNPEVLGTDLLAKQVHQISKIVFGRLEYVVESIGGGG